MVMFSREVEEEDGSQHLVSVTFARGLIAVSVTSEAGTSEAEYGPRVADAVRELMDPIQIEPAYKTV